MTSIFTDKKYTATDSDLKNALGSCNPYWHEIELYVKKLFRMPTPTGIIPATNLAGASEFQI